MDNIYISTNGCIEARLNTKQLRDFLVKNNYKITNKIENANYIIFFACGLREHQRKNSINIIKKLKKKNENAELIVWGCLTQIEPELLSPVYNGKLIGPKNPQEFDGIFQNNYSINEIPCAGDKKDFNFIEEKEIKGYKQDFLTKIMDKYLLGFFKRFFIYNKNQSEPYYIRVSTGCTNACTYCTEKLSWGYVKSVSINNILNEFGEGLKKGYKRFVLQSGDLGSYGLDTGYSLPILLEDIIKKFDKYEFKILMSQIEPKYLIKYYPELKKIFSSDRIERIGCQVQSGSDKILSLMNRRYSANEWRNAIININKKYPNIDITTHLMIGFPGEDEIDFKKTLDLLKSPIILRDIGLFIYTSSSKVRSSKMKNQIPNKIKNKRYNRLRRKCIMHYIKNLFN